MKRFFNYGSTTSSYPTTVAKNIVVTPNSQADALAIVAERSGLKHGERFKGNIMNVFVIPDESPAGTSAEIRFCNVFKIEKTQQLMPGNDANIPEKVKIIGGLEFPAGLKKGYYNLMGIEGYINSSIQIINTGKVAWEACFYGLG